MEVTANDEHDRRAALENEIKQALDRLQHFNFSDVVEELETLGGGGYCDVFKGQLRGWGALLVVKRLRPCQEKKLVNIAVSGKSQPCYARC